MNKIFSFSATYCNFRKYFASNYVFFVYILPFFPRKVLKSYLENGAWGTRRTHREYEDV